MVKGIKSYEEKERRKIRRENHAEKDLRFPKRGRSNKFNPYTDELYDDD